MPAAPVLCEAALTPTGLRAAETGRPVVQAAISGISAIIDANGLQLPYGGTGVLSTAKGNIMVGSDSSSRTNLAPGANGDVLTANSATATGLEWQTFSSVLGSITIGPHHSGGAEARGGIRRQQHVQCLGLPCGIEHRRDGVDV
jgi:hypothetical protein